VEYPLVPSTPNEALPPADLLDRARRREDAAIRAIVREHNRRLFRLARSVVGNDDEAEDVVQEAYCRAFAGLAEFRGESSLATWLCSIVLNEARGRLRRRRPSLPLESIDTDMTKGQIIPFPLASMPADPERAAARGEVKSVVEQAIDGLPEAFRTVLIARLVEGMSVEETGELFGLKPETVKTRLHRARRLLRNSLEARLGPVLAEAFPFAGLRCQRLADRVIERLRQGK
jgi:RNA polymerase sigma-70 factor (ECF subfamily)